MKKLLVTGTFVFFVFFCLSASFALAATIDVSAQNFSFSPSTVNINIGDTVRWTNNGGTHTTTSGSNCTANGTWNSGTLSQGQTYSVTFNTAGTYPYFCTFHCSVGMAGTVVVAAATTYSISGTVSTSGGAAISGVTVSLSGTKTGTTTTDSSGNFSFSSLSNGSYTLTPSLTGYTFSPTSKTVTVSSANLTGQNFTGTATSTTGKISKIGAYGSGTWLLDYQGTGAWAGCGAPSDTTKDECFSGFGWESDDMPVVGDWNGDGRSKIGVYRSSTGAWYLDYAGTGSWIGCGAPTDPTKDACYYFGWSGATPVVGDWNGDGRSKIGAYGNGSWLLDYSGTGTWIGCGAPSDTTKDACFSGFGWSSTDVPVVGDWNGNGKTKIGIYRSGSWYLDYPGTGSWIGCGAPSDTTKDECFYGFGWLSTDVPVVGDWSGNGKSKIGIYRSSGWYLDYPGTGSWIGCGAPSDTTKDECFSWGWSSATPVVGKW